MRRSIFFEALKYSVPVLLGYLAIGSVFGLLVTNAGYPWWLALVMCVFMYAGAGQYIAVGLFTAGTTLWEAVLVQLMVNARHIAYSLSMLKRFSKSGLFCYYLLYGLTDETFALLSSLPDETGDRVLPEEGRDRGKFMFYVSALNQCYWIAGSLIGAIAGSFIPFSIKGIDFALTALFVVLLVEQILRVQKAGIFVISAISAIMSVIFLPSRISLLAAMGIAVILNSLPEKTGKAKT